MCAVEQIAAQVGLGSGYAYRFVHGFQRAVCPRGAGGEDGEYGGQQVVEVVDTELR